MISYSKTVAIVINVIVCIVALVGVIISLISFGKTCGKLNLIELFPLNELTKYRILKFRSQFRKNDIRIWCRHTDSTYINRSGCWDCYPPGLCI